MFKLFGGLASSASRFGYRSTKRGYYVTKTMSRKVNAADVAEPFRADIQEKIKALPFKPLLVGFLANDDKASRTYAQWTKRSCEKDGIGFELRECCPTELEEKLEEANNQSHVHGIIIYYPCFGSLPSFYGGSMDDHIRDMICCEKDVEGLNATYRNNLYHNVRFLPVMATGEPSDKQCVLPCTPLAIVKILEHLKVYDHSKAIGSHLEGTTVTIINRSEIVGRPLSAMLANDGADVYSVDINSIYLMQRGKMHATELDVEGACRKSKVIITGVPSKNYKLPSEWIQPGTVVLNVSHFKNVNEEELLQKEGVTYVPQVGKVTVSMLERNLIRLISNFHMPDSTVKVRELGGCIVPK